MALILGIDPGSRFTGYALIDHGAQLKHIHHGTIVSRPELAFHQRLNNIRIKLSEVFSQYKPQITVVERAFLGKNVDSAFKLGHVRGVCLELATSYNSQIFEYAPRTVKKTLTGSGAAEKEQVQLIVMRQLGLAEIDSLDAADALGLALTHVYSQEVFDKLNSQPEGFA